MPEVLNQFKNFQINEKNIAHMIILHAHFDHVGIVPYFQRHFPDITVYASARGWAVLSNPKAINVINQFSRLVTQRVAGAENKIVGMDWEWRDDVRGATLKDGEKIDLGDIQIEIYETPGHSSCSISAYIPQMSALFPSDAVAIPFKDDLIVAANSSIAQYQQSLEKMNKFKIEIIGADHYGYIIEGEAKNYVQETIKATAELKTKFEQTLIIEKDIDKSAAVLVEEHYSKHPDYIIAPEILHGVYCQMLKHLSANMSR